MDATDLCYTSATELAEAIRAKHISPMEVIDALLARIDRLNPRLNAYVAVMDAEARAAARSAEDAVMRGAELGPLHGIPVSIKDLINVKRVPNTRGTKIYEGYVPEEDAPLVERLRAAGAIVAGKTNTPAFGWKGATDNLLFGATRNPWNLERTPGGSSGGASAAVAAGLGPLAVGTDGGGSIRIPSAFTGIFGMKGSWGLVPQYPASAVYSISHAGPMTRTVRDAALMLQAIAGADPRDPGCSAHPVPDYSRALSPEIKGLKIGLPREYFADSMDSAVRDAVTAAVRVLEGQGARVEEVSLPHCRYAPAAFVALVLPEASAVHARYLKTRAAEYGQDVRDQLYAGLLIPAHRYVRAQHVRTLIIQDLAAAMRRVDVLALPTVAIPAPRLGERSVTLAGKTVNVVAALARLTLLFNLSGLPAISVPCGFTADGLPIGLQLAARAFDEATVLRAAYAYEAETSWRERQPPL